MNSSEVVLTCGFNDFLFYSGAKLELLYIDFDYPMKYKRRLQRVYILNVTIFGVCHKEIAL